MSVFSWDCYQYKRRCSFFFKVPFFESVREDTSQLSQVTSFHKLGDGHREKFSMVRGQTSTHACTLFPLSSCLQLQQPRWEMPNPLALPGPQSSVIWSTGQPEGQELKGQELPWKSEVCNPVGEDHQQWGVDDSYIYLHSTLTPLALLLWVSIQPVRDPCNLDLAQEATSVLHPWPKFSFIFDWKHQVVWPGTTQGPVVTKYAKI